MPPIDSAIPLQVQRPRIVSPADLLSLRDLQTRSQLNQFNLEQAPENARQERELRQAEIDYRKSMALSQIGKQKEDEGTRRYKEAVRQANALVAANPQERPGIWKAIRQWSVSLDPQNDAKLPQEWDESLLDRFKALAYGELSPDRAAGMEAERQTYPAQQVPLSQVGQPQPPAEQGTSQISLSDIPNVTSPKAVNIKPYSDISVAELQNIPAEEAQFQSNLGATGQATAPEVGIDNAKMPEETPDGLRKEAKAIEDRGGKANYDKAQNLRARAEKLDDRIFKEREQEQPVAGAPGVTFDKNAGMYKMDGKPISAVEVQRIANENRKAGASNITAAGGDIALGKAGMTKVDEGLLDATARKQRLSRIEQSYKPEFLEVGTRLSNTWNAIKEKGGVGLNTGDKNKLVEFTTWKQQSLDNLNQYIKEITGAALSEPEARRIMSALPNPGQSWYDGDSPTQFKAGLDRAIRDLKAAEARMVYIKRNGLSVRDVPLEKMPQVMNQRGAELESILKQRYPNMKPGEVRSSVKRQLAQEFGLTAD